MTLKLKKTSQNLNNLRLCQRCEYLLAHFFTVQFSRYIYGIGICPGQGYYSCNKTPRPKEAWGEKGLCGLQILNQNLLREAKPRTQTRQKPSGRSQCRGHKDDCSLACSAWLLIEPRTTSSGLHQPQWPGSSPINHRLRI